MEIKKSDMYWAFLQVWVFNKIPWVLKNRLFFGCTGRGYLSNGIGTIRAYILSTYLGILFLRYMYKWEYLHHWMLTRDTLLIYFRCNHAFRLIWSAI